MQFGLLFEEKEEDKRPERPSNMIVISTDKDAVKKKFKGVAEVYSKDDKVWIRSGNKYGIKYKTALKGCK